MCKRKKEVWTTNNVVAGVFFFGSSILEIEWLYALITERKIVCTSFSHLIQAVESFVDPLKDIVSCLNLSIYSYRGNIHADFFHF